MRILDVAVFMILFNSIFGIVTSLSLYGGVNIEVQHNIENYNASEAMLSLFQSLKQLSESSYNETAPLSILGELIKIPVAFFQGVVQFVYQIVETTRLLTRVLKACFLTGQYLKEFIPIMPDSLANLVTTIVNVIYILGLIQFIRGVSFEHLQ